VLLLVEAFGASCLSSNGSFSSPSFFAIFNPEGRLSSAANFPLRKRPGRWSCGLEGAPNVIPLAPSVAEFRPEARGRDSPGAKGQKNRFVDFLTPPNPP